MEYDTFGDVVRYIVDSVTYDVMTTPALIVAIAVGGFVFLFALLDRRGRK